MFKRQTQCFSVPRVLNKIEYNQLASQQSSVALPYIHHDYLCTTYVQQPLITQQSSEAVLHDHCMNVKIGKRATRAAHH